MLGSKVADGRGGEESRGKESGGERRREGRGGEESRGKESRGEEKGGEGWSRNTHSSCHTPAPYISKYHNFG